MLKKSLSMALAALFVFSFIAVATLSADETQKTTGTVMSINAETGEMVVKDSAGEMKSFIADPKAGKTYQTTVSGHHANSLIGKKIETNSMEYSYLCQDSN